MEVQFNDFPSVEELFAAAERGQADPVWWIQEVLGVELYAHQKGLIERAHHFAYHPDPMQRRTKSCWASCNSAAKTHTLAAYSICHVYTNFCSKVLQTAPTASQLTQVLWAEQRQMLAKAKLPLGGELLPKANELILDPDWYMIGINAAVYEAFQGRKSPRLLIVVDEASGCKDPMFQAMEGNMATGEPMMIAASNPTRATGQVHQAFHKGRDVWNCERIDAFDLPNLSPIKAEFDDPRTSLDRKLYLLKSAPIVAPHLVNGRWAAGILQECGEDSDMWRVRVRGLFPKGDPNQLYSLGDIADARARTRDLMYFTESMAFSAMKAGKQFPWWRFRHLLVDQVQGGLDVARFGECSSVLAAQAQFAWAPLVTWGPQSTTMLKGLVVEEIERLGITRTLVDEPGLGGGPVDDLQWMATGVVPYNGGRPAWQPKRFTNMRSEAMWLLRLLLQKGIPCLPDSDRLEAQMCKILYSYLPTMERRVHTKDEMEALGMNSLTGWDEIDAVVMSQAHVPDAGAARVGERVLESAPPVFDDDEEPW